MIKYLKQEEIDYKKWDECIRKSMNSYIYAYSWYLDIVAGDWDALIEDDYKRVFPLPFRKKYGIKYIYQPPFTQQLGLFSILLQGNKKLQEFLDAIPKEFKLIDLNLNKYHIPSESNDLSVRKNVNIELDLTSDYENILSKYSSNLKRNVKKGIKNNLQISPNIKPERLIELFKLNKGKEVQSYSDLDYVRLGRLIYMLIHKGLANIFGVTSPENNLIAAALFVHSENRFIFLFSGLSDEGKELGAMPFLIDSFIQNHSTSNTTLDFEGSNDENLARFYRSFGSSEYAYYGIRKIQGPSLLKVLLKVVK